MRERVAGLLGFDALAAATVGGLFALVAVVGAVAVVAEMYQNWTAYFLMEEVVAAATPASLVLLGAGLLVAIAVVARAR